MVILAAQLSAQKRATEFSNACGESSRAILTNSSRP
jgi:hypothetical protein